MLAKFRHKYPHGSLVSELVEIDRGFYVVKVSIEIEKIVLATGLAGAGTVEAAEDAARERAIAALVLDVPQPEVSIEPVKNATSVAIKPPESITASSQPATEPPQNIVNFSKVFSEASSQDENLISDPPSSSTLESTPIATNVEPEVKPEPNLFSGTSTMPITTPPIDDRASAAIDTIDNSNSAIATANLEEMDFNEIKQKTDIEIKRLGWTKDDGREFLKSRYGKRSRLHLTDQQLLEFLSYLEQQPTPVK